MKHNATSVCMWVNNSAHILHIPVCAYLHDCMHIMWAFSPCLCMHMHVTMFYSSSIPTLFFLSWINVSTQHKNNQVNKSHQLFAICSYNVSQADIFICDGLNVSSILPCIIKLNV